MPPEPSAKSAFQKPTRQQLVHRYSYHPAKGDQADRHQAVRDHVFSCAIAIVEATPVSPEQTRALNALDEVMCLASLAIARGG